MWEPSALGYTKSDGLLVLANGEIIEDPAKVAAQVGRLPVMIAMSWMGDCDRTWGMRHCFRWVALRCLSKLGDLGNSVLIYQQRTARRSFAVPSSRLLHNSTLYPSLTVLNCSGALTTMAITPTVTPRTKHRQRRLRTRKRIPGSAASAPAGSPSAPAMNAETSSVPSATSSCIPPVGPYGLRREHYCVYITWRRVANVLFPDAVATGTVSC